MRKTLPTVALFAGTGQLPLLLLEAFQEKQQPHIILSPHPEFFPEKSGVYPLHLGQVQATLDCLRKNNVSEIVMAGKFERPPLKKLRVDFLGAKWLSEILLKPKGDDFLLSFVTKKLEKEGFCIKAPVDYLDALTVTAGCLTKTCPSSAEEKDVRKGFKVLRALSPFDVGQAVVMQQGWVLGIEAAEGTDALIQRCAHLTFPGGGPILVKTAKVGQDHRLDLPAIGLTTLQLCHQAGFEGIAFEARHLYVLEREEMIAYANEHELFLKSFLEGSSP